MAMSEILDHGRITRKWARLKMFERYIVESALNAVRGGQIHVAQYFAKLLYFLKFAPMSVEKVLLYSLAKASKGYVEKNPSLYEVVANEVPGFESDEIVRVKTAFKSLSELGIAELITPDVIKLRSEVVDDIIKPIAPYLAEHINLKDINLNTTSYPYRVISGVSAIYVVHEVNRFPRSFTIMAGLLSPTACVKRNGTIEQKFTIDLNEWTRTREQMRRLRLLRDIFEMEYFKAVGFLHENKIITVTYPNAVEVAGTFVNNIIVPAYKRYYELIKTRRALRVRK
jgi:hypothetical protein